MKWSLILKVLQVKSLRIDDLAAIRWFSLSKIVPKWEFGGFLATFRDGHTSNRADQIAIIAQCGAGVGEGGHR